ncbi:MAG: hypothetical protein HZC28_05030 [Spirochaetes bacterium]|nr:hypothetical protein [Spirochaetota bacterium]
MQKRIVSFDFPLPRTHAGIALGNGTFGALVWGTDRINITVNRADFWDHRGAEFITEGMTYENMKAAYDPADPGKVQSVFKERRQKLPEGVRYPSRLPMGRFELVLTKGFIPVTGILNAGDGVLTIIVAKNGKRGKIVCALHPQKPVLIIDDTAKLVAKIAVRPSWEWLKDEMTKYRFSPPTVITGKNVNGWIQECPDDPAMAAIAERSGSSIIIAMNCGKHAPEAETAARTAIQSITNKETFMREVKSWWHAYWKGLPSIKIPSDYFSSFFDYAVYRFACATNPSAVLPCALQGPWVEEYQFPPWAGDYTVNENIQQIYTLAFPIGRYEHLNPLFDWLDSISERMRENARILFGIENGLTLTHSVDDHGAVLMGGLCTMGALDQGCTGWIAGLYWLRYKYSGDIEFLRTRAYPFMKGAMRCYEAMLEPDGDGLSLTLSVSPEYGQPQPSDDSNFYERLIRNGKNASFQLSCIHLLADALIASAKILGEEPKPVWLEMKQKVPPYTLVGGPDNRRIGIWDGQDLAIPHRHHSHLAAIYPFDTIGGITPEKKTVIDNSIDHWINMGLGDASEWGLPWAAIILARTGFTEAPYQYLKLWRELFVNEGRTSVYIPRSWGFTVHVRRRMYPDGLRMNPHQGNMAVNGKTLGECEIMQLDGMMGAASALIEMLVHARNGVIYIFPAVPTRWKDVSFTDVRVEGGFLVSALQKNGSLASIRVKSLNGGTIMLAAENTPAMLLNNGKKSSAVRFPLSISLKLNETIELTASKKR